MATSFFGYPTRDQYAVALMATAHTAELQRTFEQDLANHEDRMLVFAQEPRFQGLVMSVYDFVRTDRDHVKTLSTGKRIPCLGWYFEHPITRQYISRQVLDWVDENCAPSAPIYGDVSLPQTAERRS